jgi:hypothetical protein
MQTVIVGQCKCYLTNLSMTTKCTVLLFLFNMFLKGAFVYYKEEGD